MNTKKVLKKINESMKNESVKIKRAIDVAESQQNESRVEPAFHTINNALFELQRTLGTLQNTSNSLNSSVHALLNHTEDKSNINYAALFGGEQYLKKVTDILSNQMDNIKSLWEKL